VLVLVMAIAMILLLNWPVIVEEEKYLEKKFGEECLGYRKRVRRWL
jgi:protein-S-isoprenylcysteine O-methyltransferase Ste14